MALFCSRAFRNLGLCSGENSSRHLNENSCSRFRAMTKPYSELRLFREKILASIGSINYGNS